MQPAVVRDILKYYPLLAQPDHEPKDLGNAGGLSGARFWRYQSALGALVLKRWPSPGTSFATLQRNHDWIRRASSLPFIPLPIPTADGSTFLEFLGHFWEVQPWMPGTPPSTELIIPTQVGLVFEALARFHGQLAEDSREEVSPGIAARLVEVNAWLNRDFLALEHAIANRPADQAVALAQDWLTLARPQAHRIAMLLQSVAGITLRSQPCLKDVRREHWLLEEGRVTGLVDFGAMDRDTVATDLSRLASDWLGDDHALRELALRSYASIRPTRPSEHELIEVFDQSRDLLLGGHWARWLLIERRDFEDPGAVIRGLSQGVQRVSRLAESRPSWMSN